ncbi:sporozoite surface protein 2 [Plasmodium sp. gorilla clade G2]|uniref:sporozoite surface protein 2 n=1 Tax=Plasmodium sp. gorilla clade G2 TaxID=880535 RepID=UPI000D229A90|nr:sporozoite surface protein 2 [Plasmodium sp. gorilla clade G2]SOV17987.1 sporozoite surface protein 2 [Plasmodium sp. gorilla clade G2]
MNYLWNVKYLVIVFLIFFDIFLVKGSDVQNIVDEVKYREEVCNDELDLYLLMDCSGSIRRQNWVNHAVPLAMKLIKQLNLSEKAIHLYANIFSNNAKEIIRLHSDASKNKGKALDIIKSLLGTNLPYGRTNLSDALLQVTKHLNDKINRPNANQLVVILTDGIPDSIQDSLREARRLNDNGVKIAVFGIGQGINVAFNRFLVGCHPSDGKCSLYADSAWENVKNVIGPFMKAVCVEVEKTANCGVWGEWSPCSVTCGKGTRSRRREILHEGCTSELQEECEEESCPTKSAPLDVPEEPEDDQPRPRGDNFTIEKPGDHVIDNYPKDPSPNPEEGKGENQVQFDVDENPENPPISDVPQQEPNVPEDSEKEVPSDVPEKPQDDREEPSDFPKKPENQNDDNDNLPNDKNDRYIPHPPLPPKVLDNERNEIDQKHKYNNENRHLPNSEDRETRPHGRHNENRSYNRKYNDTPKYTENEEYENADYNKKKGGSDNRYKIAGGIAGGLALLACAGLAYKFVVPAAAAPFAGEPAPFDEALGEEDKDLDEPEQFRLPEENDWN